MASQAAPATHIVNHDSEIHGITITFMLLAIFAVLLRLFTVLQIRHQKPAVDDYMVYVVLVGSRSLEKGRVQAQWCRLSPWLNASSSVSVS